MVKLTSRELLEKLDKFEGHYFCAGIAVVLIQVALLILINL